VSAAIDQMTGDERRVLVSTIAAAALASALREIDAENDERPARLPIASGRDVHEVNREHQNSTT